MICRTNTKALSSMPGQASRRVQYCGLDDDLMPIRTTQDIESATPNLCIYFSLFPAESSERTDSEFVALVVVANHAIQVGLALQNSS
jgi:hypothetical protein